MQQRIISLVPSITLLLFDLGLEKNIVGRTKFCIHPVDKIKSVPVIGGTKQLVIEKIRLLKPDLIIANKEENEKEQIETLKREFKVIVTEVKSLEDNYKMIEKIGKLTKTESIAYEIIIQTKQHFETFSKTLSSSLSFPINTGTLYLIWRKPYMTIGKDTFIHSMLESMGLKNMFGHQTRYPIIHNFQTSYFANCKLVFLSSEPYPFSEKHIREIQQQLPHAKVVLVDGEYFSWYGSKIKDAPAYFTGLLKQLDEQNDPTSV
ncbi:MAG: helical backbone metal receptor [Chitinophagales bacterium]